MTNQVEKVSINEETEFFCVNGTAEEYLFKQYTPIKNRI
jgi:hypothetical protein